jgi:hypothetical protein
VALYLRYTKSVPNDLKFPSSQEYVTLSQIAPEAEWESWAPPSDGLIDVWDGVYGAGPHSQRQVVSYDASDGIVSLAQPGLCGVPVDAVPNDYRAARANGYYLSREAASWGRFLVLYEGRSVGVGYDSTLFLPIRVITVWDTEKFV